MSNLFVFQPKSQKKYPENPVNPVKIKWTTKSAWFILFIEDSYLYKTQKII